MLARFVEVKEAVLATLASCTSQEIPRAPTAHEIRTLHELEPFFKITKEFSAEKNVSGSKIIPLTKILHGIIANISSQDSEVQKMLATMRHEMGARFKSYEENEVLATSTLLDPRFKKMGFRRDKWSAAVSAQKAKARAEARAMPSSKSNLPSNDSTPKEKKPSIWAAFDQDVLKQRGRQRGRHLNCRS